MLNLKYNTLPLSMNIWTEQARRLASELTMKSKIEIKLRNRDGDRGQFILRSPYGFSIIFCHAATLSSRSVQH